MLFRKLLQRNNSKPNMPFFCFVFFLSPRGSNGFKVTCFIKSLIYTLNDLLYFIIDSRCLQTRFCNRSEYRFCPYFPFRAAGFGPNKSVMSQLFLIDSCCVMMEDFSYGTVLFSFEAQTNIPVLIAGRQSSQFINQTSSMAMKFRQ